MLAFVREALHKRNQWKASISAMIEIVLALAAAPVIEQMAPARRGMLQCQMPDAMFKTCASLSRVWQIGPSSYRFETRLLVDPNGPVVVTINSTVSVAGEEVCDRMGLAEISTATVTSAGKPLPPARAARHLATIRRSFAATEGKLVCTQIVSDEQGAMKVVGRLSGKRVPAADYDMIWVDPHDGWVVAR